jgi:Cdc6-like AAA superfamily ATPase
LTGLLANAFEIPTNSKSTKKFAWIGFPHENYFVGREEELATLQGYQSSQRIKVAVVSGLGGVGKSQLAFQFAKRKKDSTNCVWMRGEDQNTLLNSVNSIARQLKVQAHNPNGTREQFEEMLTRIRSKINYSDLPWLIILDNVDSMHEFVTPTPTINSLWKQPDLFIIVTSVLRNVASKRRTAVLMDSVDSVTRILITLLLRG